MNTHQQKEKLRSELLKRRKFIPEPKFYGLSADIIEKLKGETEFQKAEIVHCYVSMNKRREVETRELLIEMLSKRKRVVVPVTNFENGTLKHIDLTAYEDLEPNKWGVLEPGSGSPVDPEDLELVIVPMVGGDTECNRLGYGEGFYDQFLSQVNCPKVGLIFDQNIVDRIPTEDFDVPLDKIITETRIIRRN